MRDNAKTIAVVKEKIKQTSRGITLIALIITIIVLLILAGVALNFIVGENGILKHAEFASNKYKNAADLENEELKKLYNKINELDRDEEIKSILNDKTEFKNYLKEKENVDYIIRNDETLLAEILNNENATRCVFESEYACEKIFGGEIANKKWIDAILKNDKVIEILKEQNKKVVSSSNASSNYPNEGTENYKDSNAFDDNINTSWVSCGDTYPYIIATLDEPILLYEFEIVNRTSTSAGGHWESVPLKFEVYGSNDNFNTHELLGKYNGLDENRNITISYVGGAKNMYRIQNISQKYKYYKIVVAQEVCCVGTNQTPCGTGFVVYNNSNCAIAELNLYGK